MELDTRDFICLVRSMGMVTLNGQMGQPTLDNFWTTTYMEKESTNGLMDEGLKETGRTIKWTEEGFLSGLTIEGMKVNTEMIKRKDKVISLGQMEDNI